MPGPTGGWRRRQAAAGGSVKPDRDTAFLRLLVEARSSDREADQAVRRVVREHLGKDSNHEPWKVRRLFSARGQEADPDLGRYFEVSGHVVVSPAYSPQQVGFDLARGLADQGGAIRRVQPDLPSSVYAPTPTDIVGERRQPLGLLGRGETDLPESSPKTWALDATRCRQAWALPPEPGGRAMGAGILIGHPDTGYTPHPELEREALDLNKDRDLLNDDADALDPLERRWWWPFDTPGHGTATGSVIASRETGTLIGAAPSARLVPIRTVRSVVQVFDGDVARAIEHARRVGCHVVSMSLGGVGFFPGLGEVIGRAGQDGLIVMAAAGNYVGFVTAPASMSGCLAVAATNARGLPWSGSSRGPEVDISAPGESVWAASVDWRRKPPTYSVGRHNGTSFAVAHLAGVAALWLAHHGRDALIARYGTGRLQSVFLQLLTTQGLQVPPGWRSGEYGAGIVDALAMLQAPLPAPSAVRAPRRPAAARVFDPFERIRVLVPELSADEARQRLGELLGATDRGLGRKLERFGAEVAYLLAEDAQFRSAFVAPRRRRGAAPAVASPLRQAVGRSASRSFAREVVRG